NYVSNAVPQGDGGQGLHSLGIAGTTTHLSLRAPGGDGMPTSVSLFDQGLSQVLQASVTGLEPGKAYLLALAETPDGSGTLQPLAAFTTNPAGSAIVNAVGPIRQVVQGDGNAPRRYLIIALSANGRPGALQQIQRP